MEAQRQTAQQQTVPPPDSTFAIQTYGCFSFIEYVPWQKCGLQLMKLRFSLELLSFFISHIWSYSYAVSCKIIRDFVRNFIENEAFLPWNIFNKTGRRFVLQRLNQAWFAAALPYVLRT